MDFFMEDSIATSEAKSQRESDYSLSTVEICATIRDNYLSNCEIFSFLSTSWQNLTRFFPNFNSIELKNGAVIKGNNND